MQLSRIGYYSDFFVYPTIIAALAASGISAAPRYAAEWLALWSGSVLLWTLLEYLLHRFALHHVPLLKEMHREHHVEEKAQIGTPTWVSLGCFLLVVFLPTWAWGGFFHASAITGGLMAGYLWYISVHHIVHHWHPAHSSYVYALKRRHALHHHYDEAANFGVTSGFWDRIFGTAAGMRSRAPEPR